MSANRPDKAQEVRKRLTALARARQEDTHWVMSQYARERLLYRLTRLPDGGRFVLKGAKFSLFLCN